MRTLVAAAAAILAPLPAMAFCGHFVGSAGAELYNQSSQVVVARNGTITTLTLATDYQGDLDEFAMLIPVPEVLGPDDVSTVSGDIIAQADAYSGARLVKYSCDDFADRSGGGGCSGIGCVDYSISESKDSSPPADTTVVVESEFTEGIYDIVVLSAEESGDLLAWLTANDYAVSANAEDMLQDYIDQGQYFFAAKVDLSDSGPPGDGPAWLEPLQLRYQAEGISLPVRLGTLNSTGSQDVIIYGLTDSQEGTLAVSNYDEVMVEHECMTTQGTSDTFGPFVVDQVDAAFDEAGGTGWLLEYTWDSGWCDPCVTEPITPDALLALGAGEFNTQFTRLHVRYTPETARDIQLYTTGMRDSFQLRYIQHDRDLEQLFPLCNEGWSDEPGRCKGVDPAEGANNAAFPLAWLLLPFGMGAAILRRRRAR